MDKSTGVSQHFLQVDVLLLFGNWAGKTSVSEESMQMLQNTALSVNSMIT